MERGIAVAMTAMERALRKKNKRTAVASTAPIAADDERLLNDAPTRSAWSVRGKKRSPRLSSCSSWAKASRTREDTWTLFSPDCLRMRTMTAA